MQSSGYTDDTTLFSHELAGIYHYHVSENIDYSLAELEEAFFHFHRSHNREKVNEIGDTIPI